MYFRPTRLGLIKFLGLWGASNQDHRLDEPGEKPEAQSSTLPSDITKPSEASYKRVRAFMLESGSPGVTICVSKRGKVLWDVAYGFCDVENQLTCDPDARLRIASISKALFAASIVAPMLEEGKVSLNDSIYKYLSVEEFPMPKFEGIEHDITIGQLLSHTSGIRHYGNDRDESETLKPIGSGGSAKIFQSDDQLNRVGFFSRKTYRSVIDALEPFRGEDLVGEPGNFIYTTYGFTLLSAVIQKAHQQSSKSKDEQIEDFWVKVLRKDWKLSNTSLDQDEPLIPKRARYYLRTGKYGRLINAPYADNSNKWAGGGLSSTVRDLVSFGQQLVDSYKGRDSARLKSETVKLLWTGVKTTYGLGFDTGKTPAGQPFVYHTGCALGASSVLIIFPESELVVAILTNIGYANVMPLGLFIAEQFDVPDE